MSWVTQTFSSTLGRKLIMSLSGLFLCSFLIVHMSGNLQLFYNDEGLAFNKYAVFMTTFPLIKVISYGLYALILVHAIDGLLLAAKNRKSRGAQRYVVVQNQSTWASRNMTILGTILLLYIIVHMQNFWYQYKFGHVPYRQYEQSMVTGDITSSEYSGEPIKGKMEEFVREETQTRVTIVKDLYLETKEAFRNPILVIFYVLGMVALAYHLVHGFQSAFQTLGWNHPKYNPLIRFIGIWVFAIGIPLAFAAMPIYFYVKSLGA
ncbi:MAG: succinate dehydrogenase cytochrome b subunit [Siphonobacter sp.]